VTGSPGNPRPNGGGPITVAVISTLPAVRAGLRALVEATGLYRVTSESASAASITSPDHQSADLLLFDAEPGTDAADITSALSLTLSPAVVILGPIEGDERLPSLLDRPFAYLLRDASREQLLAALQAVTLGLTVVDPHDGQRLFAGPAAGAPRAASLEGGDQLTNREREVLQLVAEGLPNKTIARRLGISDHTVKFHVAALMTKLNAASRTEAVHQAARRGLVSL
jgi:DNA-binding NarL/FixJ family response regulator